LTIDKEVMMLRRIYFIAILLAGFLTTKAQTTTSTTLAPFNVTLINNKTLKAYELPKNEPVMLMYFSPECDHCKELTTEIVKNAKSFG
jgi:thiol-disulfide isomerase/thioredoxin